MKTHRIEELKTAMKSFNKESYHRDELLSEMFALQKEIVELTFDEEHAATADLKIWDVERHLEQLNADCGNIADEELARFMEASKVLCNLIKAEISGNRGEYKAFKALEHLKSQNRVLKNIELKDGNARTELDAVVTTPKCITVVEVKNTAKNIFIDEEGNYYRTGEFLKRDCNIADKMAIKEKLLRNVLDRAGYDGVPVKSILVFTNNRIEVQNRFPQIRTSFVSNLPWIIDGYKSEEIMTTEQLDDIQNIIQKAKCEEAYPFEFDVKQYKEDFANLMATLEFAKNQKEAEKVNEEYIDERTERAKKPEGELNKKLTFVDLMRAVSDSKQLKFAGNVAAVFAISVASKLITDNLLGKGGF